MFCIKNQNLQLLKCPIIPNKNSYEIISGGPISIWYYGKREKKTDRYAFQIIREVIPMFFITINYQISVITQSSLPIYIPSDINVVVNGKKVQLYIGEGCQIISRDKKNRYMTISKRHFEIPKSQIIVIHCADVKRQFHDVIQIIITDEMIAYCSGKNHILLNASDTQIITAEK